MLFRPRHSPGLPVLRDPLQALLLSAGRGEPIIDYSTADLFGSSVPARRRGPVWLSRLLAPAVPAPAYQLEGPREAAAYVFDAGGATDVAVYRPEIQGWGAAAPLYMRWLESCHGDCEPVALGAPPRRRSLLRFFASGNAIMPATIDAWSDRAWPVALRIEQAVHLRPLYVPEHYQVGFCCGSPELAAEIILLITADNIEAHLSAAHGDGSEQPPCDILLPVRPGATPDELDDVVAASVKAVHTILGANHVYAAVSAASS